MKALFQVDFVQLVAYGLYRLGLAAGYYRRTLTPPRGKGYAGAQVLAIKPLFDLPTSDLLLSVLGQAGKKALLNEAQEILAGKVRLFGGEPVDLALTSPEPLDNWTVYEKWPGNRGDIKFVWEPARFGWAFTLGRAYHITADERYAEAFWQNVMHFLEHNPPYCGPNWVSAQEVAIRLMAFVWAGQVFGSSVHSTSGRMARLAQAIAVHAARIPPTMLYARSQNNNHLLVEAAGLFTAGLALPMHPQAKAWRTKGWKWLNWAFQHQIDGYGEYTQHSTNYHRLMLQVALWVHALLCSATGQYRWPRQTHEALARAVHWLYALLDPDSGRVPNLGANDGAYIFPLTVCEHIDFRPVVQSAAQMFLGYQLPAGIWDEMPLWFGPTHAKEFFHPPRYLGDNLYAQSSWAYLRAAQFTSRPSHADQLHLDLWWRGMNVAQDAGTYLYSGDPPWDNPLTATQVHNTVTVGGREQMTRAGRFLYLDWANAYVQSRLETDERILQRVSARHYGYKRLGVVHTRTITIFTDERWLVEDRLSVTRGFFSRRPLYFRLHWLLPDWEWQIENDIERIALRLKSPHGWVTLTLTAGGSFLPPTLVRAGERIYGQGWVVPILGWASATYGQKTPALSLLLEASSSSEMKFTSEFVFPSRHG